MPAASRIRAESDAQAIAQWLSEYAASPQTQRAYRKEAERLMLWLAASGLTLAELDRSQLQRFEAFLADPQPHERWVGPPRPRQHPQWRPFRRPLSAASRRQSLVILQGMFAWLGEAGWLSHNPFRLMRDKRRRLDNRQAPIERYLERPLWEWLWNWLNRPLADSATSRERYLHRRRRLIFGFAYLLAPRISEMATARMGDFSYREGRWWWRVTGKGARTERIPVPADMIALLGEWREGLGLAAQPAGDDPTPLIRALDGHRAIGDNQLYRLIKATFAEAALALESEASDGGTRPLSRQLARATPHWLRHTALTHQAQAGVELRYLAKTARHSRLDTTARYLHAEADEWQQQVAAHRLGEQ
ncbi:tyrosine-type recombinase/integrase [Halomonas sp. HP20-15]|uniref:tyrosine-type recombinase/integrase n=1 Tax=Halomonas sp. HP20-15 TaxID=3085901 RepID=UPI0029816CDA|nr:tyrosine-type recombinase/integrase [Halomonas sp. HP20-15]MDW5375511.1 tyrosine-type recombinase/integrase [Halomonas sp. HP20-15]